MDYILSATNDFYYFRYIQDYKRNYQRQDKRQILRLFYSIDDKWIFFMISSDGKNNRHAYLQQLQLSLTVQSFKYEIHCTLNYKLDNSPSFMSLWYRMVKELSFRVPQVMRLIPQVYVEYILFTLSEFQYTQVLGLLKVAQYFWRSTNRTWHFSTAGILCILTYNPIIWVDNTCVLLGYFKVIHITNVTKVHIV